MVLWQDAHADFPRFSLARQGETHSSFSCRGRLILPTTSQIKSQLIHLNVHEFVTLYDLREKMTAWQHDYNHHRPHSSLGHLTPSEFVQKWSVQPKEAAPLQF
ncbi:integrase core domain-containing protein [Pandoraea faecigallinarum]|uniref:integrase core domain-containing protein n=1 Tax=Pandoraea faecigallinarum TaxID=656179 RepID=UPI0009FDF640